MYVCHCRAVTDCRIREVIAAGATGLGEVARRSGAGITCGGCLPGVRRIVDASTSGGEKVDPFGRSPRQLPPSPPSGTAAGSLSGPQAAVAGS
jgi:bacterioferritin-associated ferredoxin